jgi:hypothetical protein
LQSFFFVLKVLYFTQKCLKYGKISRKASLFRVFMAFSWQNSLFRFFIGIFQILLKNGKIVWRHGNIAFELP